MEAFEDCANRVLVQDERDEFQAAAARACQGVDVIDALQELRQSIRIEGPRRAAGATCLGATATVQCGDGSLHGRARIGKVGDLTIRAAALAVVIAAAAAVLSGEQMPSSSR